MKVSLIGTFYERHERTRELLRRVYEESTRPPDEMWLMCEGAKDYEVATKAARPSYKGLIIMEWPTPRTANGDYAILPYSYKINYALDNTNADAIVYLDNGSMPHPRKYELMAAELEVHPEYGAVYCSAYHTGIDEVFRQATQVVEDAYCVLNFTQVMNRPTADRWTLDLNNGRPYDLADALFWRSLHKNLGSFYPVKFDKVLDVHRIEGYQAVGL